MAQKISKELKSTVEQNPHIEQVHFTKKGEHFFNAYELEGKKYARLAYEPVKVGTQGEKVIYKKKNRAIPDMEIVETLSREDILGKSAQPAKGSEAGDEGSGEGGKGGQK